MSHRCVKHRKINLQAHGNSEAQPKEDKIENYARLPSPQVTHDLPCLKLVRLRYRLYIYKEGQLAHWGGVPNLTAVILYMDETTFLLPARSCSSSSPSVPAQPDRRVLANESGSSSSPVLEAEAPSRYRGLREIAILFRASVPGASSSSSSSPCPIHPSLISSFL